MAKDIGLSCPLCLNVYDPDDMLAVEIPHARFPQSEPAKFCRPCVIVFMKSAVASDLVDPREVFGAVEPGQESDPKLDEAPAAAGNREPEVGAASHASGNTSLDRPEPKVSAGGEDGERAPEKG